MTAHSENSLFSHPDVHHPATRPTPSDEEGRPYADLFREPTDAPADGPEPGRRGARESA